MSLSDAPAPPPDVFANVRTSPSQKARITDALGQATFWVDGSVSERDTVVANIEVCLISFSRTLAKLSNSCAESRRQGCELDPGSPLCRGSLCDV